MRATGALVEYMWWYSHWWAIHWQFVGINVYVRFMRTTHGGLQNGALIGLTALLRQRPRGPKHVHCWRLQH